MKKFLTLMIIAAATIAAVPRAEARPRYSGNKYVSGRTSCGCPVYTQRHISYHDHCGHPVYQYRRLPVIHRCRPPVRYRSTYRYPTRNRVYRSIPRRGYRSSYAPVYRSPRRCR